MSHIAYEKVPVFYPTLEEMSDFVGYMEKIDKECLYAGICKIVPPKEWFPHHYTLDNIDFEIATPIIQYNSGGKGIYQQVHEETKASTFKQWEKRVTEKAPKIPDNLKKEEEILDFMERRIWKNVLFRPAIYGSDLYGSLFTDDCPSWNLRNLDSYLSRILKLQGNAVLPGINSPYLYVGSYKSLFSWHCEDLDLFSINFMHFGQPKIWYTIPSPYKKQFEDLAKQFFPEEFANCSQFLRHKTTLISPSILKEHGIKVTRVMQNPGEFIITLPGAYHQGFNWDINVNEAVNFATRRWIDIGKSCKRCLCDPDSVRIDLNIDVDALYNDNTQQEVNTVNNQLLNDSNNILSQLLPLKEGFTKYFDESTMTYSYPFMAPAKVYDHEIQIEEQKKKKKTSKKKKEKVVNNNCLKVRIVHTNENGQVLETNASTPTIIQEKKTTSKKKVNNSSLVVDTTSVSTVEKITKQRKTKKQHHPLFAKFYSRQRFLK
ncbi:hypothetical protein ABK040_008831 [Willaertia magna]